MNDPLVWSLLVLSAFAAGVVNTIAGGGTLLTFPALVWGLALVMPESTPAEVSIYANMTSTVALIFGSVTGAWAYRRELATDANRRWTLLLLGPSFVGGILGSLLVALLDPKLFNALVPWLIVTAALLFLVQPALTRYFTGPAHDPRPADPGLVAGLVLFQFAVAVYGGYFGAGIGILMLATLGLMGLHDIRDMNAVKNLLAAVINGVTVVVFVIDGRIVWPFALAMAVASVGGGLAGAHLGRTLPRPFVHAVVVAVGLGVAAFFFAKQLRG